MMFRVIAEESLSEYLPRLRESASHVLPALGFLPDEVEAYIGEHENPGDTTLFVVETAPGQAAFCRGRLGVESWHLHSLLPSTWPDRYAIIQEALVQIKEQFLKSTPPQSSLSLVIPERPPTSTMYFMALLPGLGFSLTPRAAMSACAKELSELPLPALPERVHETPFHPDRLPDLIDFFHRAFKVHEDDLITPSAWALASLGGTREGWAEIVNRDFAHDDAAKSSVILESDGKIVGAAYGRFVGSDVATLLDLAVAQEWFGQGLGEFLVLQCARRLREQRPENCREVVLYTLRHWSRAVGLYCRLGFRFQRLWTEAALVNRAPMLEEPTVEASR